MKEMTRRDFFKLSAATALLIGGGGLTGCSSTTTLSTKFGEKADLGDMYAKFTLASEAADDNNYGVAYLVTLSPKDGKSVTVQKGDFKLRLGGIEPKEYSVGPNTAGSSPTETQWTVTAETEFVCAGLFIKNNEDLLEESQMEKIRAFQKGTEQLELEAILTHKNKKVRAVTQDISRGE